MFPCYDISLSDKNLSSLSVGDLPHSGLEVGKRDGREQSESTPALDTSNETREQTQGDKEVVQAAACGLAIGGTSASEENKELNQLHSAERDSDITKTKSTLPSVFSVDSRNANGRTLLMNAAIYGNV
ncbi:uncharacterized protein [Pocillopora verrucosa]|uniref:uncharacterized protein isoform X1 n=1 Tax=Pocillopora verrucosa TaxID=203993 RepID=UPI0033415ED8